MWLVTTVGFFSVVQKPWDVAAGTVTVRARVREDLEALRAEYLPSLGEVKVDRQADYRYRAQVPQPEFAAALSRLALDIDYDNFKNAVARRQGSGRAHVYHNVWDALYPLQRSD